MEGNPARNHWHDMLSYDVPDEKAKIWLARPRPRSLAMFIDTPRSVPVEGISVILFCL